MFSGTALADTVVTGMVTSINGSSIKVFDATSGITYTVGSSVATVTKNGVSVQYYNINAWDNVTIQGVVNDTSVLAWFIDDRGRTPLSIPVIFASTISQNTTWHDGQIIIINNSDGLTVQAGVKLTIEAGAIVKLANYNDIKVYGDLEVKGSPDKPVFITSFGDDTLGGDCNGDGAMTAPGPGWWGKLKTVGLSAQINIDYAQIKYGGGVYFAPCFAGSPSDPVSTGNTITITHSNLLDNEQLFELGSTDLLKINYSNFWNPDFCYQESDEDGNPIDKWDCGSTIENRGDTVFDLSNNYWGSPLGPTPIVTNDDWNNPVLGTYIIGQANYMPFLTSPWTAVSPVPNISNLGQFKSDNVTPIAEGANIIGGTVVFQGTLTSSVNNQVKLQVEVEPSAIAFKDSLTASSSFISSGQIASVTVLNLSNGQYHWQARAIDSQGNALPWQTMSEPAVTTDFSIMHNPVIFVPGIEGSYLKEKAFPFDKEIWPDPLTYTADPIDEQLNELKMNEIGNSIKDLVPTDVLRNVWGTDIYGGLIDYLKVNGYQENKDLYIFPYDWRLDIDTVSGDNFPCESTTTLKCFINWIKARTETDKVDIVAHSMGGLVVKDYVAKFGQNSINKFIDMATPHLGTPKAAKILEYGDNLNIKILGVGILNPSKIKDISLQMPSIYQLLPSPGYFNLVGNGYGYYLYNNSQVGGANLQGELNYSQSLSYLAASNNKITSFFINKNSLLHSQIDDVVINNSYNISGCGTPTIGKIQSLGKKAFLWDKYGLEYVDGDDTVPLKSADFFADKKYYLFGKSHMQIPSTDEVKDFVFLVLNNQEADYPFAQSPNFKTNDSICKISGKTIEYHCPVEMNIYDDQGNHTGPTVNGDIENNIPGVQYDIIDGNKFAFLPTGGNYRITGTAVGTGTLEVAVKTVENDQYVNTEYFNSIPLQSTSVRTEIDLNPSQDSQTIKVDANGDGVFEENKTPDAILTGSEMNDLVKPATTISIAGTKGNNGYYVSDVKIDLAAADDNSGVLKTEYSLDGGKTWINYAGQFAVSRDGTTTILYSSTDKAGNREENKIAVIKIDQIKPTINPLLPQEGQEVLHSDKLNVTYFAADNFSGIATATAKIYLDGQIISSNTIDSYKQNLGAHQIKITIQDLAGNQAEQVINFFIISSIEGTIADVNRAYDEKMITKIDAKNNLVSSLTDIKTFQEKYGQRIDKEKALRDKAMAQCLKQRSQAWCNQKIGNIFSIIDYQLNLINQAIIKLKYNLILAKLDVFLSVKWINQTGYNIIKADLKYLLSKF
jgi:hypothetical protein